MKDLDFYILGPKSDSDTPTYWNVDKGWVEEFDDATPFPPDILTVNSPINSIGIMPCSSDGEPKGFYTPLYGVPPNKTPFKSDMV